MMGWAERERERERVERKENNDSPGRRPPWPGGVVAPALPPPNRSLNGSAPAQAKTARATKAVEMQPTADSGVRRRKDGSARAGRRSPTTAATRQAGVAAAAAGTNSAACLYTMARVSVAPPPNSATAKAPTTGRKAGPRAAAPRAAYVFGVPGCRAPNPAFSKPADALNARRDSNSAPNPAHPDRAIAYGMDSSPMPMKT